MKILQKQIVAITTDRNKLQQEVLYLQSLIKQQQPNANLNGALTTTQTGGKKPYNPKNVKAASVCLLIVLFSFGILFKSTNPNLALLPGLAEDHSSYTGRTLQSLSDSVPVVAGRISPDISLQLRKEPLLPVKTEPMEESRTHLPKRASSLEANNNNHGQDDKRKRMKISDDVIAPSDSLVPINGNSQVEKVSNELAYNIRDKPNTSYIYCSEAQHIAPAITTTPETIALLIPSNLLNMTNGIDPSLLEVSCQVLSYYLWPLRNATST